jgi:flagellar basal body rod protein FlgG
MPGSHYIALSGLRARMDQLDRLAADIANVGTSGYKGERAAKASAERPDFPGVLRSAIDTTIAGRRLDLSDGALAATGRSLDVAIDGPGFFVVDTPGGPRYTRNGHFAIGSEGKLTTEEGAVVRGVDGPIGLAGSEPVRIDDDGTVWSGAAIAGRLLVVEFAEPAILTRESGAQLHAHGQTATPVARPVVRPGSLEQSNVQMADRIAELTSVARGFEALQKALSVVMNDVDGRAIEYIGRR